MQENQKGRKRNPERVQDNIDKDSSAQNFNYNLYRAYVMMCNNESNEKEKVHKLSTGGTEEEKEERTNGAERDLKTVHKKDQILFSLLFEIIFKGNLFYCFYSLKMCIFIVLAS